MNFDKILSNLTKNRTFPIKTIIFCDPGMDDTLMLLQILGSDKYDIVGIVPVSGNVDIPLTLSNTLHICELVGRTDVNIYSGSIEKDNTHHIPIYGETGLGSIKLAPTKKSKKIIAQHKNGIDFTCEALQQDKYLIISTGLLTEPAKILQILEEQHPNALKNIIAISMMGGVINSTQEANWPVVGERFSEANLAYDAQASQILFDICAKYHIPIFLVPLDLTHSILASKNDIQKIQQLNTPAAKLVSALIESVPLHYQQRYQLGPDQKFRQPLHDVHASHCLLHPEIYHGYWVNIKVSSNLEPEQITIINKNQGNVFLLDIHYFYHKQFFTLLAEDLAY